MSIKKELKDKIVKQFATSEKDTGSSEVQVALLSERIRQVAAHLKTFPKDKHSRVGLLKMVCKRRSHLGFLKKSNLTGYNHLVSSLKEIGYL